MRTVEVSGQRCVSDRRGATWRGAIGAQARCERRICCHVLEAGNPLEAFDELEGASFSTDVFAVAGTEPESIGIDLRNHLDGTYLDALVVGVGDPAWTPTRMRLAPNDFAGSLHGHVRALLRARAEAHPSPPRHEACADGPAERAYHRERTTG